MLVYTAVDVLCVHEYGEEHVPNITQTLHAIIIAA